MIQNGKNYLLTLDNWFVAPDGKEYMAVWGKCTVRQCSEALGFNPTRSSNWIVEVDDGKMIVAGCQLHFAVQTDEPPKIQLGTYTSDETKLLRPVNRIYIPSMNINTFMSLTWDLLDRGFAPKNNQNLSKQGADTDRGIWRRSDVSMKLYRQLLNGFSPNGRPDFTLQDCIDNGLTVQAFINRRNVGKHLLFELEDLCKKENVKLPNE
ncbi:hypothetical protein DYU11_22670 [Fibrisoma montanum]|uniref:Uncharacterized protein n=1 Tax=Fibrisoma montanum TaxID=2305895 RepID=A0A418M244_9BACT|nr:hypothetical protein [Fibrisoma montanum]RIV19736.1 hypothetical protein DYU11_22670 [Fibrisoma montanum]